MCTHTKQKSQCIEQTQMQINKNVYTTLGCALHSNCIIIKDDSLRAMGEVSQISTRNSNYHKQLILILLLQLHPFNGFFSRTTWVSRYQKGKTSLDLNEARVDGVLGWQWHQLDHMQTICTSLQRDNHSDTSSLIFLQARCSP